MLTKGHSAHISRTSLPVGSTSRDAYPTQSPASRSTTSTVGLVENPFPLLLRQAHRKLPRTLVRVVSFMTLNCTVGSPEYIHRCSIGQVLLNRAFPPSGPLSRISNDPLSFSRPDNHKLFSKFICKQYKYFSYSKVLISFIPADMKVKLRQTCSRRRYLTFQPSLAERGRRSLGRASEKALHSRPPTENIEKGVINLGFLII